MPTIQIHNWLDFFSAADIIIVQALLNKAIVVVTR